MRPEFFALSTRLARVNPSSTDRLSYSPTSTLRPICEPVTVTTVSNSSKTLSTEAIVVPTTLPFRPSQRLCSCMLSTLECTAPSWDYTEAYSVIRKVCDDNKQAYPDLCRGTKGNPKVGEYGSYAWCNITEQAAWVLNQQFVVKQRDPSSCTSSGGRLQEPVKSNALPQDCGVLLKQVGPDAIGSVSITPAATATASVESGRGQAPGAQVKIAIGVSITVVFVILGSALGAFCVWTRRQKNQTTVDEALETPIEAGGEEITKLGVVTYREIDGQEVAAELDSPEKTELAGDDVGELVGDSVAELEGSPTEGLRTKKV